MRVFLKLDVLQEWLLRNCKTNGEFSELSGIHPVRLSKILKGKCEPGIRNRAGLLNATKLDFDALFRVEKGDEVKTNAR